jgi:hypothetical protein
MTAVRIYRPARTAMQSGEASTQHWVVEFEPGTPRVPEPLMGWTGTSDTRSQMRLRFPARAEAVAFAERHGLDYVVQEPRERRVRPKVYADNFRVDRKESWSH